MKFLEKIAFIEGKMNISDGAFCARYKMKYSLLKKWRAGQGAPTPKDVKYLCKEFNLDVEDFLDDTSTLAREVKEGEHPCKVKPIEDRDNVIYEDYVREDNSRYEEKD